MTRSSIAAWLALAFLLAGPCRGYGESLDTYFPKKAGMTWEYSLVSEKSETRKIVITNLPQRELKGKTVLPRKWDLGGNHKYDFFAEDGDGVYLYAEQNGDNAEPVILEKKAYYLRNPLDRGTTWDLVTKCGQDDLKLNLTIESTGDVVTTPAGTFQNCLKIKHVGEAGAKEKDGAAISATAYEWYAPKVGWVKSVVSLKKKTAQETTTENQTFQLQSFKP